MGGVCYSVDSVWQPGHARALRQVGPPDPCKSRCADLPYCKLASIIQTCFAQAVEQVVEVLRPLVRFLRRMFQQRHAAVKCLAVGDLYLGLFGPT